ncbi:peptidoglycan D,D-transpeptidase FtsI family protein [Nautilia profundicola]|uniref:peptidoglycan D,D-transpeptidase FtsI family protein n=1 Tax=Nautilia profundicola TaxID=244787 RepID=UPI001E3E41DF|nr:penicillin-binding protein 2 [Nautilia profundicola]
MFFSVTKPKSYFNPKITKIESAIRGSIKTKNFTLAKSEKIYSVYINPTYIVSDKKRMFIDLFSIYTGVDKKTLYRKLRKHTKRILLAKVDLKTKQQLVYLRKILDYYRVFTSINGVRRAYDIESVVYMGKNKYEALFKRLYPYGDTFEPFLGRYLKDKGRGDNGIEDYYDNILRPQKNGKIVGYRDVSGNIIYDKNSIVQYPVNGKDIELNINLVLQRRIEKLLDEAKSLYQAKEVMAAVMDSKTGKILAIATSNRFNPLRITKKDIPNMKISAIRYLYEPGSVMKPITFAILLENKKVNPYEVLNAYNGKWKPKWRKTYIRDDDAFAWLSAENALVYSSNIVISQLALRLTPKEFYEGLKNFGFSKYSGIDLPYEIKGVIRSLRELNYPIYKSTTAYGYGIMVNFIQLLKAYNAFNNNGIEVTPKIANVQSVAKRVISAKTANEMLRILRKIVLKGTAKNAYMEDIFTAGKTGTAHVSVNNRYEKIYNSSFFGFANDKSHKYTIGVTFLDIKAPFPNYFASQSAVPLFKKIVIIMKDEKLIGD